MTDVTLNTVGVKIDPRPAQKGGREVEAALGRVEKAAEALKRKLKQAVGAFTVAYALREFANYNQELRNVATVAGATEAEFRKLNETAKTLALGTRFDPQQIAQGMYSLASAGQSVNEQLSTLPNVLNLAEAAQAEMGQTTELVVSALKQFGLEATESQRVVDVFTASIASSATNVPRLQVAMANSGATANAMNQEFESSVAVLSLLTTGFVSGEKAGTGYKSLLAKIANDGEKLGLNIKDAAGDMLPLVDILEQIKESAIPATDLMEAFGTEAGPALSILLEQGTGAIENMTAKLLSQGQAAETAAKQLDTLKGDWDQLKSTFSVLSIEVAENLEPALRFLVQTLNDSLFGLRQFFQDNYTAAESVDDLAASNRKLIETMEGVNEEMLRKSMLETREALFALTSTQDEYIQSLRWSFKSEQEIEESIVKRLVTINNLEKQLAALKDRTFEVVEATKSLKIEEEEAAKATETYLEKQERLAKEAEAAAKTLDEARTVLAGLKSEHMPIATMFEDLANKMKALNAASKIKGFSAAEYKQGMKLMEAEAEKAAKSIADKINGIWEDLPWPFGNSDDVQSEIKEIDFDGMFDGFAASLNPAMSALQSFKDELVFISQMDLTNGEKAFYSTGAAAEFALNSMANMAEEGSDAQKKLQAAAAVTNTILAIAAILEQGKGDPYTAFARMAAMAAMVTSMGVQVAGAFGGSGGGGAEQQQAIQGTGTVLGDATAKSESIQNALDMIAEASQKIVGINSGMLRSLQTMNNAISGTVNQIAQTGGIGELGTQAGGFSGFGSLLGATGITGFLDGILFGKSKVTDRGVQILSGGITEAIDGTLFQAYEVARRSGLFGSSSRTNTAGLEDGINNQISLIFESMRDTVLAGAEALGVNLDGVQSALDSYRIEEQRISLLDLNPDEQREALQSVFSSIFDGLTEFSIPFITQFQQAGEGLGETLGRVATTVLVFEEAIASMGLDFIAKQVDPELFAQAAVSISEFAGGIESFIDGYSNYVSNFLSETEQFNIAAGRINGIFEDIGLSLPTARDGFTSLIQSLDLTTEAGQEAFGTLISLSNEINSFYSELEGLWESFFESFYSDYERASSDFSLVNANAAALQSELGTDLNFNSFRTAFEAALPTLSPEDLAKWLRLGDYLAEANTLAGQLAETSLESAISDYLGMAEQLNSANYTLGEQLQHNYDGTMNLISAYDGTITAEERIAESLRTRYEMEMDFIEQIRSASQSVSDTIARTRESIEMSLLDDEGQYEFLRARAESLAAGLDTMTDPNQIRDTINQIDQYTNQAYGLLDESQRQDMAPEFLTFLDDIGLIAQDRLTQAQEQAEAQSQMILSRLDLLFSQAQEVETQNQNRFAQSVMSFEAAVARLQNLQVNVNVNNQGYEIGGSV